MVVRTPMGWRFELIRPGAGRVYLVGDFGEGPVTIQMADVGDGCFVATIDPPPGAYRFRYHVDGRWLADYAAFGVERRDNGEFESVLYVPRPTAMPLPRRWAGRAWATGDSTPGLPSR